MTKRTPREINEILNKTRDPRNFKYDADAPEGKHWQQVREDDLRNEREEVIEALRDANRTIRMLQSSNSIAYARLDMLDKLLNIVNGRQSGGMAGGPMDALHTGRYDALADRLEAGSKK